MNMLHHVSVEMEMTENPLSLGALYTPSRGDYVQVSNQTYACRVPRGSCPKFYVPLFSLLFLREQNNLIYFRRLYKNPGQIHPYNYSNTIMT